MVRIAGRVPRGYSRIADDVAVVPPRPGKLVVKTDMLVEHTDMPPGMTYRQAAGKAIAMCVSDFGAKGVKPDSFLVSLGLGKKVTQKEVNELARGMLDAERKFEVHLVGGDTNESRELVIDCVMIGFGEKIVTRSGASPGDRLVVTGPFGYPPAGLKILVEGARASARFERIARRSVLEPSPKLEVGLALAPYLTSAMDSSDGLARSVHTLAKASKVGFEVDKLPIGEGVQDFANSNGLDAVKLVLEGGEEYEIVGTVRRSRLADARAAARKAGGELLEIGKANAKVGLVELTKEGRATKIRDEGWTHLR